MAGKAPRRAACGVRRAACGVRRAACGVRRAACGVRRGLGKAPPSRNASSGLEARKFRREAPAPMVRRVPSHARSSPMAIEPMLPLVPPSLPPFHPAATQTPDGCAAAARRMLGAAEYSASSALVPFHFVLNEVRVDATIEDEGPFHLILDTGMPVPGILLFRSPAVDALGLADSGMRVQLAGAGGAGETTAATVALGTNVALGELRMTNVAAMVVPQEVGMPPGVDGVIGGALFFRYVVRIDVDSDRVELLDSASYAPPADACVVPLVRVPGAAFVDVRVAVDDGEPIPARVVVDIGAGHALSLNTRGDGALAPPAAAIEAPVGRGLSGEMLGRIGRVRRLEVGTFTLEDVVVSFPVEEHRRPGGFDFRDGNLGMGILKRFVMTFDYASNRLVLEKGAHFGDPFVHDMSGISWEMHNDGSVSIRSVLAGSPAGAAGVQVGDELVSIDGHPVGELGGDGVREALTVADAEVALELRRGTEVVAKRIRLRRLV